MTEELAKHLEALARDECYVVKEVLKESTFETTELVYFRGDNGAELGPFVRKLIDREAGIGSAYQSIFSSQQQGRRFLYLPRILDCHEAGSTLVVVVEYVNGETLAEVVYRCDPSVELGCDIFPRLCDAVRELHEAFDPPIIHRDLKPSNIVLSRDSLTIIDFGIARTYNNAADEDTHHFGTRAYAPPEQFGYGQTSIRSDVYALGLLLYFCLTEKTPDAKAREHGYASKHVPELLRSVIVRATAFDPEARYASAAEMKRDFLAVMEMLWRQPLPVPDSHPSLQRITLPSAMLNPTQETVLENTPASRKALTFEPTPDQEPEQRRGRGGLFMKVAGLAWDALLGLAWLLYLAASISMTISPEESSPLAQQPLLYRSIMYVSISFFIVLPVLYLISDRRILRKKIPLMRAISWKHEVLICACLMVVCVIIVGVAGAVFKV